MPPMNNSLHLCTILGDFLNNTFEHFKHSLTGLRKKHVHVIKQWWFYTYIGNVIFTYRLTFHVVLKRRQLIKSNDINQRFKAIVREMQKYIRFLQSSVKVSIRMCMI